ncbi:MAG: 30S ribosomal protein S12 methylthiotransferase RimO [Acidobacteria bacterium]|nr:30S ribosomal protein S12 methylthiotransferase RimO [Acidobacteriota bacterium]
MKIGFLSLGCPKNLVDSEVMLGLVREAGHEITPDARDADTLVVNTCAFIDSAKQESIDAILEMAELKKTGRCRKLVVTGCLAERYRDTLCQEIPEIDVLLGTGEVPAIVGAVVDAPASGVGVPVSLVRRSSATLVLVPGRAGLSPSPEASEVRLQPDPDRRSLGGGGQPCARELPTYIYDADTPRVLTTPRHYAYVKIAEGCDYKCAFCIIPTLRGHYRSRPADEIVREVEDLAGRGVREVILISQDTTFYGVDRGERSALPALLRRLNRIDGVRWIRLLYLYPTTITDDVLQAMAACDKVCKYVDLPLQHASDPVLRRMQRPGSRAVYEKLLARIRAQVTNVSVRTTFIVGFPGEREEDLAALCDFVRQSRFDHVGVFTYSHEEGTTAHSYPDDVPMKVKRDRRRTLMALQKRVVRARHRDLLGRRVQLLVDGRAPESELVLRARLEGQAPEIDSAVYLTECDPHLYGAGKMIDAEIVSSRGYDLVARPLAQSP